MRNYCYREGWTLVQERRCRYCPLYSRTKPALSDPHACAVFEASFCAVSMLCVAATGKSFSFSAKRNIGNLHPHPDIALNARMLLTSRLRGFPSKDAQSPSDASQSGRGSAAISQQKMQVDSNDFRLKPASYFVARI